MINLETYLADVKARAEIETDLESALYLVKEVPRLLAIIEVLHQASLSTSKNSCCDTCQQAKLVAIDALSEADKIAGEK